MKKAIVVLLLIVLIFSTINSALANSFISIWFAPEQGKQIDSKIESLVDSAQKSIYVAVYNINDEEVVNDLLTAYQKGIDVRVIFNKIIYFSKILNSISPGQLLLFTIPPV